MRTVSVHLTLVAWNVPLGEERHVNVQNQPGFCAHCPHQAGMEALGFPFPLYVDLTWGCRAVPHSSRHVFSFACKRGCVAVGRRGMRYPAAF